MYWPKVALLSLCIFWAGLVVLLTKWPRFSHKSISQHAASDKKSYHFFTIIQSFVGLITYIFMIVWFIPHFELSILFTVIYSLTAWLQITSSFIPDTGKGLMSVIHSRLAYSFAIGMMLSTALLCLSSSINGFAKVLFATTLFYMIYSVSWLFFHRRNPHQPTSYLMRQIIYIVSFQVSILYAAFFG